MTARMRSCCRRSRQQENIPLESVRVMDRIVRRVEGDPIYRRNMHSEYAVPKETKSDAISAAARKVAETPLGELHRYLFKIGGYARAGWRVSAPWSPSWA